MQNYDCYRMVQQNHDTAKQFRNMHRDYLSARTKKFLANAATLAAFLCWLNLLEGMGGVNRRYRFCRDCKKEWNVSRTERSEKVYICPKCEYQKRKSRLRGANSETAKG